ncbi:MAG: hypothetical protein MK132_02370 [Lentisphaerales bacterium]|nr:hypothetical protein [Lentisphaerales bacterium]
MERNGYNGIVRGLWEICMDQRLVYAEAGAFIRVLMLMKVSRAKGGRKVNYVKSEIRNGQSDRSIYTDNIFSICLD